MHKRALLGRRGEEIGASFLARRGYQILARNYRCRYGEIDIIAAKDAKISFVEVKTRTSGDYGSPGAAVTYPKQQKIKSTALTFLQEQAIFYQELSFDVLEILVEDGLAKLRWLPGCF